MNETEIKVVIINARVIQAVCGSSDEYLRAIRKAFGVRIVVDAESAQLIVRGSNAKQVQRAANLLEQLQRWVERDGQPLVADDVKRAIDQALQDQDVTTTRPFVVYCGKTIRAKTAGQAKFCEALRKYDVVFCSGPAGVGKTYLAAACAVEALRLGEVRRIILVRPAVEAGENLGFLPGDFAEKINPYLRPLFDALADMTEADMLRQFIESSRVEIAPLAYMRGRTLNDAYIILDEAQNTTVSQMKMFLTRMGYNSRVVVCGDASQSDLARGVTNGFVDAYERLKNVKEIARLALGRADVVRHSLVQKIVDAYEHAQDSESASLNASRCAQ
ncbi:MAG: PhoH family protein [Planctomycetia bacterium]|nr:PhoH family protein [Planctomycetia bacterium]